MPKMIDHYYIRLVHAHSILALLLIILCFKEQNFRNQLAEGASIPAGEAHWAAIDCACPEDQLIYECSVQGGIATVWRGSAFDCGLASNDIILRHSKSNPVGDCNNGRLVAQIVAAINGTFTSQLNVTISEDLHNKTVECAIEYVNGTVSVINMNTIIVASDFISESSPDLANDIHLTNVNITHLRFSWSNKNSVCSDAISYQIQTTNCGDCPDMIISTNVSVCALPIQENGRECTFQLRSQVCGNINGLTQSIAITPKLPDPPEVKYSPHYNNGKLLSITTMITFMRSHGFNISDGIDGSPIRYTIIYSDSTNEKQCSLAIIEASSGSCEGDVCTHTFDVSSSSCSPSTDISVSVFATNILGDGPHSASIQIDAMLGSSDKGVIPNQPNSTNTEVISYVVSSIFAIILLCLCTVAIIIVCTKRLRSKLKQKKMKYQAEPDERSRKDINVVYEEIDELLQIPKAINTTENTAYNQLYHVPDDSDELLQVPKPINTTVTENIVYNQLHHTPDDSDKLGQVPKSINTTENIAYSQLHHTPDDSDKLQQVPKPINTTENIAYSQLHHTRDDSDNN